MKQVSWKWALLVGLLIVLAHIIVFVARFERWNTDAAFTDYLLFFLAGTLGGVILIYYLNKQISSTRWWMVLILFLLASPIAMLFMLGGGLLGPLGVVLFPQIPWALILWVGAWVGNRLIREG